MTPDNWIFHAAPNNVLFFPVHFVPLQPWKNPGQSRHCEIFTGVFDNVSVVVRPGARNPQVDAGDVANRVLSNQIKGLNPLNLPK